MKWDIITHPIEIKRIIKKYYNINVENLDEMDQFLERHNLLKFTQGKKRSE